MTVPFGIWKRMTPSEAATAQPSEPSVVLTEIGVAVLLYSSMNSSFAPAGPLSRNSLIRRSPSNGPVTVVSAVAELFDASGSSGLEAPLTVRSEEHTSELQ